MTLTRQETITNIVTDLEIAILDKYYNYLSDRTDSPNPSDFKKKHPIPIKTAKELLDSTNSLNEFSVKVSEYIPQNTIYGAITESSDPNGEKKLTPPTPEHQNGIVVTEIISYINSDDYQPLEP
ncbi:MAG: hypothetical protein V3V78_03550 [Candidatus Woesearchaeota archaeon]